jgi:hypothetical protein
MTDGGKAHDEVVMSCGAANLFRVAAELMASLLDL